MLNGSIGVDYEELRIALTAHIGIEAINGNHISRNHLLVDAREEAASGCLLCANLLELALLQDSVHRLLQALLRNLLLLFGNNTQSICVLAVAELAFNAYEVACRYIEVDNIFGCHIAVNRLREGLLARTTDTHRVNLNLAIHSGVAEIEVVVDHINKVASSCSVLCVSSGERLQIVVLVDLNFVLVARYGILTEFAAPSTNGLACLLGCFRVEGYAVCRNRNTLVTLQTFEVEFRSVLQREELRPRQTLTGLVRIDSDLHTGLVNVK